MTHDAQAGLDQLFRISRDPRAADLVRKADQAEAEGGRSALIEDGGGDEGDLIVFLRVDAWVEYALIHGMNRLDHMVSVLRCFSARSHLRHERCEIDAVRQTQRHLESALADQCKISVPAFDEF